MGMKMRKMKKEMLKKRMCAILAVGLALCLSLVMSGGGYEPLVVQAAEKVLTLTGKDVKNGVLKVPAGSYSKIILTKSTAGAKVTMKNVKVSGEVQIYGKADAAPTNVQLGSGTEIGKLVAKANLNLAGTEGKQQIRTVSIRRDVSVVLDAPVQNVSITQNVKDAKIEANKDTGVILNRGEGIKIEVNADTGWIRNYGAESVFNLAGEAKAEKVSIKGEGTLLSGEGKVELINVLTSNVKIEASAEKVKTAEKVAGVEVHGIEIPAASTAEVSVAEAGGKKEIAFSIVDRKTQEKTKGTKTVEKTEDGKEQVAIVQETVDPEGNVVRKVEVSVDENGITKETVTDKDGKVTEVVKDSEGNEVKDEGKGEDGKTGEDGKADEEGKTDDKDNGSNGSGGGGSSYIPAPAPTPTPPDAEAQKLAELKNLLSGSEPVVTWNKALTVSGGQRFAIPAGKTLVLGDNGSISLSGGVIDLIGTLSTVAPFSTAAQTGEVSAFAASGNEKVMIKEDSCIVIGSEGILELKSFDELYLEGIPDYKITLCGGAQVIFGGKAYVGAAESAVFSLVDSGGINDVVGAFFVNGGGTLLLSVLDGGTLNVNESKGGEILFWVQVQEGGILNIPNKKCIYDAGQKGITFNVLPNGKLQLEGKTLVGTDTNAALSPIGEEMPHPDKGVCVFYQTQRVARYVVEVTGLYQLNQSVAGWCLDPARIASLKLNLEYNKDQVIAQYVAWNVGEGELQDWKPDEAAYGEGVILEGEEGYGWFIPNPFTRLRTELDSGKTEVICTEAVTVPVNGILRIPEEATLKFSGDGSMVLEDGACLVIYGTLKTSDLEEVKAVEGYQQDRCPVHLNPGGTWNKGTEIYHNLMENIQDNIYNFVEYKFENGKDLWVLGGADLEITNAREGILDKSTFDASQGNERLKIGDSYYIRNEGIWEKETAGGVPE